MVRPRFLSEKNHKLKSLFLIMIILSGAVSLRAQTTVSPPVQIGTETPPSSAILDVSSTTQGILIPRMTEKQRDLIDSPVGGLLIFQTNNASGFYYYVINKGWSAITPKGPNKALSNLTTPTAVNTSLLPGTTGTKDIGSATLGWRDLYATGGLYLDGLKFIDNKGSYNTFLGTQSGNYTTTGSFNSASGYQSLKSNDIGSFNTAHGAYALYYNQSGNYNTAVGEETLFNNYNGIGNTATGYQSLYNTTFYDVLFQMGADFNTADGYQALFGNTTGGKNTAQGHQALYSSTTGFYNTAQGDQALYFNTIGNSNTGIGEYALRLNTSGNSNTGIGGRAIISNSTGNYNTGLGDHSDVTSDNLSNASAVGYYALVDGSNKVRIGNTSVSSNGGQVNWTASSDARIKDNVQENVPGLEFIKELHPVTYHYNVAKQNKLMGIVDTAKWDGKYDIEKIAFTGFLAQEVDAAAQKIAYDFSGVDKSGDILGLRYAEFVVPLVKAVQELSGTNDELKNENEKLQLKNKELENRLSKIETLIGVNEEANVPSTKEEKVLLEGDKGYSLGQNVPNPFTSKTTIPYILPSNISSASIVFHNERGIVLKTIELKPGSGTVEVETRDLASGVYQYSLIIEGRIVSTKQMDLIK